MSTNSLGDFLARSPFLQFAKLGQVRKSEQQHTLLGFEPLLKNHIGTLHAGALFTAAHADAQARLNLALQQHPGWKIAGFTSQIVYKRPAKARCGSTPNKLTWI